MTPSPEDVIRIARQFLYVREAQSIGQNRGLRVEAIQHWSGGAQGDSWCMEFVWMILDIAYQGHPPFDRMQSCEALRAWAQDHDALVKPTDLLHGAIPGMLYLFVSAVGRAHHVGIVTGGNGTPTTIGIAGNTSPDGTSSNGDGVYEHVVRPALFVDYAAARETK